MKIDIFSMSEGEFQAIANLIKEGLLRQLEKDGVAINSKELSERYAVILARKGWLGSLVDKALGHDGDFRITIVKIVG